jgi:choline dehydrogenase-like flavoprotein
MQIGASGSVMANRYNYFDLDPTYRNAFGQPLMRMTFDYKENEHKMGRQAASPGRRRRWRPSSPIRKRRCPTTACRSPACPTPPTAPT